MPVRPLILTMGEPAGVGGEITLAAWRHRRQADLVPFAVLDDPARLRRLAPDAPITEIDRIEAAPHVFDRALPVLAVSAPVRAAPAAPVASDAPLVIEAIERAAALCVEGRAGGMVTNPINKALLYDAGFGHPGHTEFVAALSGGARPVMMIAGPSLKVVPATIHLPLKDVPAALAEDDLVGIGRIVCQALASDFALQRPRIAFAGLNPHAGEQGALGDEEVSVIAPAVRRLQDEGFDAVGPLSADTMFHAAARRRYDAAICMYHDQALIPAKALDFDEAVNVTLGLPIVRTSPDHGTAFAIAGTGKARPASLIAAIRLAGEMAARRARR